MGFRRSFPPNSNGGDYGPPPPPFRIRQTGFRFRGFRGMNKWIGAVVVLIILFVLLDTGKGLYINYLWFKGAGFESVYAKMLRTQVILFLLGGAIFGVFFGTNVFLAARLALQTPARGLGDAEAASLRRLYQVGLLAGTIFLAVIFGTIAAGQWSVILSFMEKSSFGVTDPQFHRDVGFFVFTLPALRFFYGWLLGAVIITTLAVAGLYLFRYLAVGRGVATSRQSLPHLCFLLLLIVALFVCRYWLARFELDLSKHGTEFGAGYTDVHARLIFMYVGMALAAVTGLSLLYAIVRRNVGPPIALMIVWALIMAVGGGVYPSTVQRFSVQPNELEKERPYIQRNIDATRHAFALDSIEEKSFPAAPQVTQQEISDNQATINNIRLLDPRALIQTYAQIQTIRPLYEFLDVDVDRYVINGVNTAVMLSARELSSSRLPVDAQSWVNRRLEFTHGYGAVMSPVNSVVQEGLPDLLLQDIPVTGQVPITQPDIYYGQEPDRYVIVNTKAKEFDYPLGESSAQNVFNAGRGVRLGSIFQRFLLAWNFSDLNIAISGSVTSSSRILFHRNIADRVATLAPFLTLDHDPYLVIADGRMYWIQDAYTTTDRFPYSTPASAGGYNYIRNSVKVVMDAYDGTTTFYLADPNDPIIQTYARIFPKLFTPLDRMPASLRAHIRYPEDLFLAQVNLYNTYHITDPGQLYNKEDIWSIPTEISTSGGQEPLQPYYVIMRLPGETTEEFVEILPLSPARRSNTIAWLAARSDPAEYGKLIAYRFPTDSLVFGPQQVESRIDQDPNISAQFTLWNQSGSRLIRGNLLMIPIGQGNLFVEPIYLQAETSQLPELKRVVVANGNNIAMEPTLEQSLKVVFGQAAPSLPETGNGTPATTNGLAATPTPAGSAIKNSTPVPVPPATAPLVSNTSVGDLARQADAAYQQAQDALHNGDFATYGQRMAQMQSLIKQIEAKTQ